MPELTAAQQDQPIAAEETAGKMEFRTSEGLPDLLASLRGTVLASTYQAGKLLALRVRDGRLSVLLADAGDHVPRMTHCVDVILLDAYDRQGLAQPLLTQAFHDGLRDRLNHGGILVMNLVGAERLCESQVCQLADAFGAPPLVLEVPGEDNRVVFAFRVDEFRPDWAAVENRALVLAQRHPIPFPRFAMELRSRYETCSPAARR